GPSTETVEGEVDPAEQTTHYQLQYGFTSSQWCKSFGAEGSPEDTTALETLGFSDGAFHKITIDLSGLTPGKAYCATLVVSNPTGAAAGNEAKPLSTGFIAGAPGVTRPFEVSAGAANATIEGEVDPADQSTNYKTEYALASSKWCTSLGFESSPEHMTASETL